MISPSYVRAMARYNAWQNANVYGACERLSDAQRKEDRGAFFGSIHATLNHILWADQTWLTRFGAAPAAGEAVNCRRTCALRRLGAADGGTPPLRCGHRGLGRRASQPSAFDGDLTWVSGGCRARDDAAQGPAHHAYLQSSDASSRSGECPADRIWRQAGRHRSAVRTGRPLRGLRQRRALRAKLARERCFIERILGLRDDDRRDPIADEVR